MKLFRYITVALTGVVFASAINSCDVTDLEAKDSPNQLVPTSADLGLYTNSLQENFVDFFEEGNEFAMEPVRMLHMFGPLYRNAYTPQGYNDFWSLGYATIIQDANEVITLGEEAEATYHVAVAKIFRAMTYSMLVDMFGDVPYAEANQGAENLNPANSSGSTIYADMQAELDEAIDLLANTDPAFDDPEDYFYGGAGRTFTPAGWIALANSWKFRMALNAGDGPTMSSLISNGANVIDNASEDFQFVYSTVFQNPDSRHPQYGANYDNGGSDYMSLDYMDEMINGKPNEDPRLRYYFYRQSTSNTSDPNEKPCIDFLRPGHYPEGEVFCLITNGSGYWGRDHGDDDGIPPDNTLRTIWGLYPIGGKYDANDDEAGDDAPGASGAGVSPIMLSSYVYFMRAEAAFRGFTGEDASDLLELGIRASMSKVLNFNAQIGYEFTEDETPFVGTDSARAARVDQYVTNVDPAATDINEIVTEFWLAAHGNGYEIYNAYRRTGAQIGTRFDGAGNRVVSGMQPTIAPDPGDFINSHFYSANFVNLNSSVDQKTTQGNPVFWQSVTDLE